MNIISSCKLLLILLTQAIHGSNYIKHLNEESIIAVCKGNDVDLHWKVDERKDKIIRLEWYFRDKKICNISSIENFTVMACYQGRIERIGKTDIRLKNVSLDDEGTYILFPSLEWSISKGMNISIQVLEPPTDKCTCKMGPPPDFKCELPKSHCGRPEVSVVWRKRQTFEILGDGNWSMKDSTLNDKEILYCLGGEAMQCADDYRWFCSNVSNPRQDNDRPPEDGNSQHTDSVTPDDGKTQHTDSVTVPVDRVIDNGYFGIWLANLVITSFILLILITLLAFLKKKMCLALRPNTSIETIQSKDILSALNVSRRHNYLQDQNIEEETTTMLAKHKTEHIM